MARSPEQEDAMIGRKAEQEAPVATVEDYRQPYAPEALATAKSEAVVQQIVAGYSRLVKVNCGNHQYVVWVRNVHHNLKEV